MLIFCICPDCCRDDTGSGMPPRKDRRWSDTIRRHMSKINDTISKGEQCILDQGLYVAEPICFLRLFSQSERDVLNAIRHSKNCRQSHISLDALVDTTGLSKNTVRTAIASLSKDRFLKTPENPTNKDGTDYQIQYVKINNIIKKLNEIKDPKERGEKAKELRTKF